MAAFAAGEVDVLVATTVIEVGVDVPNATMMVIWDAERFGISQLHQLRGRIGRGEHPGVCLLISSALAEETIRQRLDAVAAIPAFTPEAYAECEAAVDGFAEARELVLAALPDLGWVDVAPADGAFYVYAGIAPLLGPYPDSVAWCRALLAEQDVALTPGVDFDPVHGHEHIRLSLAAGPDAVRDALPRILAFQAGLRAAVG